MPAAVACCTFVVYNKTCLLYCALSCNLSPHLNTLCTVSSLCAVPDALTANAVSAVKHNLLNRKFNRIVFLVAPGVPKMSLSSCLSVLESILLQV